MALHDMRRKIWVGLAEDREEFMVVRLQKKNVA